MWSRMRYRRLQAITLLLLAALLTASACLGALYQRSMEQALAGYELGQATSDERALRVTSPKATEGELAGLLPAAADGHVGKPVTSRTVDLTVDNGRQELLARLYAVDGACDRLSFVAGACPATSGEVAVSDRDVEVNGWTVGSQIRVRQTADADYGGPRGPSGTVTVVGVYRADPDADWLGAPLAGRAGRVIEGLGLVTDDWVTVEDSLVGERLPARWYEVETSVAFPLDLDTDVDALVAIGPAVADLQARARADGGTRVDSSLKTLAERVDTGREQGRTTVVVLVAQLLILVAVVLWMVLCAATDDRRPEIALARLRGRGRRGAQWLLVSELLPICLTGVLLGVALAPVAVALVSRATFPVPVPTELPRGFVLSALGAAGAVTLVVLTAAIRATREPLDSLLRSVPVRRPGTAGDVAAVVFSITTVAALVTGTLDGPLATLAPTLLAVAGGLVLGRALGPVTRATSRRLLARGRAVPAAGVVNAVRRPTARRVLVMVVVASALVVFCCAALVTSQQNRQNAAEQANGAPYSLSVQAPSLRAVTDAVAAVDPDHEHVTPVVFATPGGGGAPTVAVDPVAFRRVAFFPLVGPDRFDAEAILAPDVDPVRLQGTRLAGSLRFDRASFSGDSERLDDARIRAQVQGADGQTALVDLARVPRAAATVAVDATLDCADGCVLTGLVVTTPPGLALQTAVVVRDLAVDGAPVELGTASDWRSVEVGETSLEASDDDGALRVTVATTGSQPPALPHRWVPTPVPALVTSEQAQRFDGAALGTQLAMSVAGTLPWVPGAPPGARVVDVAGLQRQTEVGIDNRVVEVWTDDAAAADDVTAALRERGASVNDRTPVTRTRDDLDASPAAWSLALAVLVGAAGVLVAALVMLVSTATTWRARATDLAALRIAGLPDRSLRRIELLAQLPVVVVGSLAGAGLGVVAAVLTLPDVRQFTEVPEVDTTDFGVPWPMVAAVALATLVVLGVLALATSRWTARRARLERVREVV